MGLGLDFSEIDLWWVLNKRARFLLDNQTNNLVKNNITFYCTNDDKDQQELLETLKIKIVNVKLDHSPAKYEKAYNEILTHIQNS